MADIGAVGDLFAGAFTGGAGGPGFGGSSGAQTGPTTSGGGSVVFGQVGASTGNNTLFLIVGVAGIAAMLLLGGRKKGRR